MKLILIDLRQLLQNLKKKSYSLEIKIEGEGTVEEEIIVTGKSTDYLYGTKVRLTPSAQEGSDFIKWKGDYNGEESPLEITINKATNITANFEYFGSFFQNF